MTRRLSEISIILTIIFLFAITTSDAYSVTTKWALNTTTTSSGLVSDGNLIYSVTDSGLVNAFDRISGGNDWFYQIDSNVTVSPIVEDGLLYVGAENGVYAFDSNGNLMGFLNLSSPVMTPLIASEGNLIAITQNGDINVIAAGGELSNSKLLRTMSLQGETESSTVLYSGILYVFLSDGRLFSVDPFSGSVVSLYNGGKSIWHSTPVVVNDTIYVGAGRYFMGITTYGNLSLIKEMNSVIYSPSYSDGIFYFGSDDGNLYAVDKDGNVLWSFSTGDAIRTTPLITNNSVYFGSHDKKLYSISKDGNLKWSATLGDWPSDPIIVDGVIYTVSYDGSITALSPIGCIISVPSANTTVSSDIVMSGQAYADNGVSKVELRTIPGDWQTVNGKEQWSTLLQVSGFAEGKLGIECKVTDSDLNTEIIPYEENFYNYVLTEEELPLINATFPKSVNVNQPITVDFVGENNSPITNLTITIGSQKYNLTDSSGQFDYTPSNTGNVTIYVEKLNYQPKTIEIYVTAPLIQPIYVLIFLIVAVAVVIFFSVRKNRWR